MTALGPGNALHGDDHDVSPEAESSRPLPALIEVSELISLRAQLAAVQDGANILIKAYAEEAATREAELRARLAEAVAEKERMWCQACGTVTRDGICDCNCWGKDHEMHRSPNFINYADAMQETAHAQAQLLATATKALEAALVYLDNSDSPGGCDGKDKHCEHCRAIALVRAALTDGAKP